MSRFANRPRKQWAKCVRRTKRRWKRCKPPRATPTPPSAKPRCRHLRSLRKSKRQNPKSEYRNPKQNKFEIGNTKTQTQECLGLWDSVWNIEFRVSNLFLFRISIFVFR